jgi:hypothetical protein
MNDDDFLRQQGDIVLGWCCPFADARDKDWDRNMYVVSSKRRFTKCGQLAETASAQSCRVLGCRTCSSHPEQGIALAATFPPLAVP